MRENKENIAFYESPEFSDLLGRTFNFFIREFRNLVKMLLVFVAPVMLLNLWTLQKIGMQELLSNLIELIKQQKFSEINSLNTKWIWVIYVISLFQTLLMTSSICVYIKLYIQKGSGNFNLQDIWEQVKKYFFPVLGLQLLVGLVVILGVFMCVIPGLFLAVALFPAAPILIFEDRPIGESFSRSFHLSRGNWFKTLLLLLIIGLVLWGVDKLVASLFILFDFIAKTSTLGSILQLAVSDFVKLLTSSISVILSVVLYTSFVAQKENPELEKRINNLAEDGENNVTSEEQENDDESSEDVDRFKPRF